MGDKSRSIEVRKKHDERIRKLFYVILTIFLFWIAYSILVSQGRDIFELVRPVLNGFVTVFMVIGLFSFLFYRKYGMINSKNVLKTLLIISFSLSVFTVAMGYSLYRPFLLSISNNYLPGYEFLMNTMIIFLIFFFSYLVGFFFLLLQGFGLVSIIVIFQRKYFPGVLDDIKKTNEMSEEENIFDRIYHTFLAWIFDIPKVLSTREITIEKRNFQETFSWKHFRRAFFLESILAVVLAIYISLNPLLLAERSLSELFALASSVSYFIPVVVLPLFIFRKLRVKIPGPAADFYLFEGVRSRLLSLMLALGTIFLFLRLALRTLDPVLLINSFLFYFVGFLMNTFFITFVYFNYFEDMLAEDILDEFDKEG